MKSSPIHIYCIKKICYHISTVFLDKLKDIKGHRFIIKKKLHSHDIVAFKESRRYRTSFLMVIMIPCHYVFIKYMFCRVLKLNIINTYTFTVIPLREKVTKEELLNWFLIGTMLMKLFLNKFLHC